jgi:hypothetical protein
MIKVILAENKNKSKGNILYVMVCGEAGQDRTTSMSGHLLDSTGSCLLDLRAAIA